MTLNVTESESSRAVAQGGVHDFLLINTQLPMLTDYLKQKRTNPFKPSAFVVVYIIK